MTRTNIAPPAVGATPVTPGPASKQSTPTVAVVIPTWSGKVGRLLASLEQQRYRDFTVEVVQGVAPAGRARNLGAAATRSELILFVDDDAYLADEHVLGRLIETLTADPAIGVVGTSKLVPPDASAFQQRVATEVPRWVYPEVSVDTVSNPPLERYGFSGITTTCCLMRRELFEALGGFDETLDAGEDTEFFYRAREAGVCFVVPAHCAVYHPPPASMTMLVRKHFRYGHSHAVEALRAPGRRMWLVPLDRPVGLLLLLLSPLLFIPSNFIGLYFDPVFRIQPGFKPLKAISLYATLYGYTWCWLRRGHRSRPIAPPREATAQASDQSPEAGVGPLARGSAAMIGAFLVIAVLNYAFAILMSWYLPVHEYGVLGVVQALLLLGATAIGSGFPWALTQVVARERDPEALGQPIRATVLGNAGLALVLAPVLLLAAQQSWFGLTPEYSAYMLLTVATILALGVGHAFGAVLQGSGRLVSLGLVRGLEVAVKLVVGVALVLIERDALGALAGFLIGALAATCFSISLVGRWDYLVGRGWFDRRVFAGAGPLFLGVFSLAVLVHIDIVGLNAFSPAEVAEQIAGHYQAAVTLARIPIFLTVALFSAIFPYVARHASDSPEAAQSVRLGLKYSLLFIVPLSITQMAAPEAVLRLFFSSEYAPGAEALAVAAAGTIALVLVHALTMALQAGGLVMLPALLLPCLILLEVATMSRLVPGLGAVGAAGSLVVVGATGLLALLPVSVRTFRILPGAGSVGAYLLAVGALWLTVSRAGGESPVATALLIAAGWSVYVLMLVLTRLLTPADLRSLASGLDTRSRRLLERLTAVVGKLNLIPLAG